MQGAIAIKEKILSDAKAEAERIIADAKERAEMIVDSGKAAAEAHVEKQQEIIDGIYNEVMTKRKVVTELECRKLRLNEKRKTLDEIFDIALTKLKNIDADKYRVLIKAMLKVRDSGDKVIISVKDKELLKGICPDADASGSFDKGIILSGASFDKNLTFENEMAAIKDEMEGEISREIG
jgi:vacuolar-type H+-ATPase subunit E/Vma4